MQRTRAFPSTITSTYFSVYYILNRYKFCHYLTEPMITRIIVSLVLENVIIRIEIIVFRDFMTLAK